MADINLVSPAAPLVSALPTAAAGFKGQQLVLKGNGTTTADVHYVCLMSSTGTYAWKQLVSG